MNYKLYNLEKNIKKVGRKLVDIILYLPKTLYQKNLSLKPISRPFLKERATFLYPLTYLKSV